MSDYEEVEKMKKLSCFVQLRPALRINLRLWSERMRIEMKVVAIIFLVVASLQSLRAEERLEERIDSGWCLGRREQISTYRPVGIDHPAKKEPTRIEIIIEENYARKEEDELPEYLGAFAGAVASTSFILFDLFLGSIGLSGYYVNYEFTYIILGIGLMFGFLSSYSTYVRKEAMREHLKTLQTTSASRRV